MKILVKTTPLVLLLFLNLALSVMSCSKEEKSVNVKSEFQGNVIIVGAGAAGLAAAKKLEEKGIGYQILEATDKVGGRIQKNENFADFPIDLGAEWIHEDKSILNYLINQPENEPNIETILYQPMNVQQVVGNTISQIPNQDMIDYYADYITEYKFKNTTWYDYIDENFAQNIEQNIIYNSKVTTVDYTGNKVVLTTENGTEYQADKVILTVSVGVLKSNAISFNPPLSLEKTTAIQDVEFLPGFKLFMKFSDQFYPDVITCETSSGEKTYYDVAYGKESEDHVLGLLSTGTSAEEYYTLGSSDEIVTSVLKELDTYYNGLASQNYVNSYLYKDWSQQAHVQGTWTSDAEASSNTLNTSIDDKVYFAGETYNEYGISQVNGFYIIRGSVQSAILSGYEVVYRVLE
ncbi:MAG: monoamine oxidase [Candidatus Marivariicella framensis]|jgi:monoamine oxidase|tara:strand:+ start:845 stop:2059 length:1215 start_codon:yes stop_codon:yes gene_type:complete